MPVTRFGILHVSPGAILCAHPLSQGTSSAAAMPLAELATPFRTPSALPGGYIFFATDEMSWPCFDNKQLQVLSKQSSKA